MHGFLRGLPHFGKISAHWVFVLPLICMSDKVKPGVVGENFAQSFAFPLFMVAHGC